MFNKKLSILTIGTLVSTAVIMASSCSHSIKPTNRTVTTAFKHYQSTTQGKMFTTSMANHPSLSGYAMLKYGKDAYIQRLSMIRLAEKSLDLQYYIWENDATGRLLTYYVTQAADRGVKVRILLDDLGLKGRDKSLSALDAHPNIEIRIFNPFTSRDARGLNFLTDFSRLNHRMHNKVFLADNAIAITGGRNIGDHYFSISEEGNFRDLDLICAGPIVREVSQVYDYFWNAPWSVQVRSLTGNTYTKNQFIRAKEKISKRVHTRPTPYPVDMSRATAKKNIAHMRSQMIWAHGSYVWNDPVQLTKEKSKQRDTIIKKLDNKTKTLTTHLYIESPYFVPLDSGVNTLTSLVKRGVKVKILTNSLKSNDVLASHAGYATYRKTLIQGGVEMYEFRPDAKEGSHQRSHISFSGSKKAGLHTKALVFDGKSVFIGSYNLDPRSSSINTEGGLYIESRALAKQLTAYMMEDISPQNSYRVALDDKNRLIWIGEHDGKQTVYRRDPESGLWARFLVKVIQTLPVEEQL